jgi:tetratricopeptide (TPR) repeat protein
VLVYGQESNYGSESNNILNKFGYQISLLNLNKYDSNILKLSSNTSDFSSGLYPSVAITYPFSAITKLTAQYLFGLEKYASTSFLNTNFNRLGVKLSQYFSPSLSGQISGYYIHSDQPDILTTSSSVYRFATFNQYSTSFKLNWLKSSQTLYSFEYSFIQRNYSQLLTITLDKQRDNYNYLAFSWTHQIDQITTASVKLGFINSKSNNAYYKFNRQFFDVSLSHNLGSGFKVQAEDMISSLRFSNRTLTNDPLTTRSDVINTFMIGIKKNFNKNIALNISYYLQKDFSNEPIRKFLSHSVNLGVEFVMGKDSYYPDQYYSSELGLGLDNNFGLNKEKATVEQLTNTGYQYMLKGNYEKALEYSLKALSLNDNIEQAHINAGIAYYKKGEKMLAATHWKTALILNPQNKKLSELIRKLENEINTSKK